MKDTVIGKFVSKLLEVTESSKPFEDALNTYTDFLANETNFTSQNFDYILQDYKKGDMFKKDEWEKTTEQQHNHMLSVISAMRSGLSGTLCYIVAGIEDVSNAYESQIKELLPQKEYKNTFPFSEIRHTQHAIFSKLDEYLANEDITDIIIDAPTGVGKSPIAIASLLRQYSGYLVTANKALQDQYLSEFNWLADLRGKSNYRCNVNDGFDCSSSPCNKTKQSRKECRENFGRCDYGTAKSRALSDSKFSLLNMHTLISYAVYVPDQISPREMLIIDEAHSFPEVMSSSVGLALSLKMLTPFGVNSIPKYANPSKYEGFLQDILERIQEDEDALTEENEQLVHKIKFIKGQLHSGNLSVDHEMNQQDVTLVERLKMYPVRVEKYYNKIKKLAPIRIHLSATILGYETYCNMLGIDQKNVAIIRTSSPFPKEIRPVYLNYSVGQMNAKSLPIVIPQLINRIEYLMDHYKDYKGMIHGVTYHLCNQIYSGIRQDLRARLLFARSSREQNECLSRHRESKNTVLLSPSMTEGIDLKDELCYDSETEILTESGWVPFPNLVEGVRVAAYTQNTEKIHFEYPQRIVRTKSKRWSEYDTMTNNLVVTSDHTMLWRKVDTGTTRLTKASEAPTGKSLQFVCGGVYENMSEINLSDDQIRLAAAMQADGNWVTSEDVTDVRLTFRRDRKKKRIKELLDRLEYKYHVLVNKRGDECYHVPKSYIIPLMTLGKWSQDKHWDIESLFRLDLRQRRLLLAELPYWNGSNPKNTRKKSYTSSLPSNLDTIAALAAISGFKTTFNGHAVHWYDSPYSLFVRGEHNYINREYDTEMDAYCVTVSTGLIVVRRRGKSVVSGNCRFQIIAKTPYPYLGDPLLQLRKEIYSGYYEMLTATTVMQAYGRATRHQADWSHTYIMDDSFRHFVQRNPGLFPNWFLEAITW